MDILLMLMQRRRQRAKAQQPSTEEKYLAALNDISYAKMGERGSRAAAYDTEVDTALSTGNYTTFYDRKRQRAVVVFRGTDITNTDDLDADVHVATGSKNHRRFMEAEQAALAARQKYGDNVWLSGHSLGGALALHANKKTGNRTVVFNPGGSAADLGANASVVRNRNDLVSRQYSNVADNRDRERSAIENVNEMIFGGAFVSQLKDHGLDQFLRKFFTHSI